MATAHREPNQVKWIGVRPGHNGEQIIEFNTATNATVIIYTVPADKILLLNGFNSNIWSSANGTCYLQWWDAVPALYRNLASQQALASSAYSTKNDYMMPLELDAGHSLRIVSPAATLIIKSTIWGILIDA